MPKRTQKEPPTMTDREVRILLDIDEIYKKDAVYWMNEKDAKLHVEKGWAEYTNTPTTGIVVKTVELNNDAYWKQKKAELIAAAEAYHSLGIPVLPFVNGPDGKKKPDCRNCPNGKWEQWKTQPQTDVEFQALHIENYEMFGVVCGASIQVDNPVTGEKETVHFTVIDRDVKDPDISGEVLEKTADLINGFTPAPQRESTRSGGNHLNIYSRKPVEGKKFNKIGMELLGLGNLAVVAPSKGYTRENDNSPPIVNDVRLEFFKMLKIFGLIGTDDIPQDLKKKPQQKATTITEGNLRPCFTELMKKEHLEHDEKVALIYEMVHTGKTDEEILQTFYNNQAWEPAPNHTYSETETKKAVEYTIKKAKNGDYRYKKDTIQNLGFCASSCPHYEKLDCRIPELTIGTTQQPQQQAEEPDQLIKVPYDKVNEYLEQGYKVTKKYAETAILEKKTSKQADEGTQESQADRLIKLCENNQLTLFVDQHGKPYARVTMPKRDDCDDSDDSDDTLYSQRVGGQFQGEEKEEKQGGISNNIDKPSQPSRTVTPSQVRLVTLSLRSRAFKNWLSMLMWESEQKAPNSDALNSAINVLSGKCEATGTQYTLYNRVAPTEDGFYIDMANDNWQAIKVTAQGWEIVDFPPILFKRYQHQKPLTVPKKLAKEELKAAVEKLFDFININPADKDTRLSFICSIISYFIPSIPHPMIVAYGAQGSAKTYCFKLVKRIIDPSSLETLDIATIDKEVVQQLDHHWLVPYDNLTSLPTWASNLLCRAVTGAGISKRELYSDDDDIIYNFKRCVMLNGINPAARKGDLLNRSILTELEPIPVEKRKTEREVDAAFNEALPTILGGFLGILAEAIKNYKPIKTGLQRLADFNEWGCAISEALGYSQEDFIKAYAEKVEAQNEEALNANPTATALIEFCTAKIEAAEWMPTKEPLTQVESIIFETTPTDLYHDLTAFQSRKGRTDAKSGWPQAVNTFTRTLNMMQPTLAAEGCKLSFNRTRIKRVIVIDVTEFAKKHELKAGGKDTELKVFVKVEPLEVITTLQKCGGSCGKLKELSFKATTPKGDTVNICEKCAAGVQ